MCVCACVYVSWVIYRAIMKWAIIQVGIKRTLSRERVNIITAAKMRHEPINIAIYLVVVLVVVVVVVVVLVVALVLVTTKVSTIIAGKSML